MRGLSIVLVVMFHAQLVDMATGANHSLCTTLPTIFTPIRMPFFIFTSGGLLYLSRIRREWTTRALYADKLRRIAVPFVFFVTFYYLFKLLAGAWAKPPRAHVALLLCRVLLPVYRASICPPSWRGWHSDSLTASCACAWASRRKWRPVYHLYSSACHLYNVDAPEQPLRAILAHLLSPSVTCCVSSARASSRWA